MLKICIFGAGRMGRLHALTLSQNPRASLSCVVDIDSQAAKRLATQYGARVAPNAEAALSDPEINAVIIATPAGSHAELLVASAQAGKAIFCEKPIAQDISTTRAAVREVRKAGVPTLMGFMKRFDPSFHAVIDAVRAGEVGKVEMVLLTNRDPKVTLLALLKATHEVAPYTLLRESTVHDFDMARALLCEEPVQVYVAGSSLVEPEIAKLGEIDTAMITLTTTSGALCHINNSWRAAYGYDQRVEVFGPKGMLRAENRPATSVVRYVPEGALHDRLFSGPPDSNDFFMYKYAESYPQEINHFIDVVERGVPPMISVEDGFRAQLIVESAVESLKTGRPVKVASCSE